MFGGKVCLLSRDGRSLPTQSWQFSSSQPLCLHLGKKAEQMCIFQTTFGILITFIDCFKFMRKKAIFLFDDSGKNSLETFQCQRHEFGLSDQRVFKFQGVIGKDGIFSRGLNCKFAILFTLSFQYLSYVRRAFSSKFNCTVAGKNEA